MKLSTLYIQCNRTLPTKKKKKKKQRKRGEEQGISEIAIKWKYSRVFFLFLQSCTRKNALRKVQVYLWQNGANELDQRRLVIALERANKLYSTSRFMNHARRLHDSTPTISTRRLRFSRTGRFRFIHPARILDKLVHLVSCNTRSYENQLPRFLRNSSISLNLSNKLKTRGQVLVWI